MVYAPQRRHVVANLATTIQSLGLIQHLYGPNILILLARLLTQFQLTSAAAVHPTRSLFSLFLLTTMTNMSAILLHMLDFVSGMNGGKGLLLDFVGQGKPVTLSKMLILDVGLYILQLTSLVISYATNHTSLPSTPSLPYDDLLLPQREETTNLEDEHAVDIESGLQRRRRRKSATGEEDELWLNGDNDGDSSEVNHPLLSAGPSISRRVREPPLIFSISLPHMLDLIFHLPAPPTPTPAFAGGTPMASPTPTPTIERQLPNFFAAASVPPFTSLPPSSAGVVGETREEQTDSDTEVGGRSPSGRRARGAMGMMPDIGRIPGDYWVEGRRSAPDSRDPGG